MPLKCGLSSQIDRIPRNKSYNYQVTVALMVTLTVTRDFAYQLHHVLASPGEYKQLLTRWDLLLKLQREACIQRVLCIYNG